ncbi:phage tail assembly chaperone [Brevundimonas sp. PAMC22021]|nr:phage tail assembly chaperone [Brevundimonas sp. PAMC22021]
MMRAAAMMGVGPDAFWRLSLKEWRMLTARAEAGAPLGRGEMSLMMERWPDE